MKTNHFGELSITSSTCSNAVGTCQKRTHYGSCSLPASTKEFKSIPSTMENSAGWRVLTSIIMLILLLSASTMSVFAWGEDNHMEMADRALQNTNSPIATLINANRAAYNAGLMAADVTVVFYWLQFSSYQATHDYSFFDRCYQLSRDDEERAFCYGIKTHEVQDTISHNEMVPACINKYKVLPNILVHAVCEQNIDKKTVDQNPMLAKKTQMSLSNIAKFACDKKSTPRDCPNNKYDTSILTLTAGRSFWSLLRPDGVFTMAVESGNTVGMNIAKDQLSLSGGMGAIVGQGYDILLSVSKVIPMLSDSDYQKYLDHGYEATRNMLESNSLPVDPETGIQYDPTGINSLSQAETGWNILRLLLTGLAVFQLFRIIRRIKK